MQFPQSVVDTAREFAEREFRRLLEPFDWRGVLHKSVFVEADPRTELAEALKGCDLLVLGTHGRSGVARAARRRRFERAAHGDGAGARDADGLKRSADEGS